MACITSELLFVDGEHIVDFAGNILMTSIIGPRYKLKGMQSVGSGGVGFNLPDAVQLRSEDIELDALVTATHPASGQGRYLAQVQDVSEKALLLKWETSPACSRQRDSRLGIHNPSIFERMIAASQGASWAFEANVPAEVMGWQVSPQETSTQDSEESSLKATLPQLYGKVSRNRLEETRTAATRTREGPKGEEPFWSGRRLVIPSSMAPMLKELVVPRQNVHLCVAPSNKNCPGGHHLLEATLKADCNCSCDGCHCRMAPGHVTFTCSMCNFDICQQCREIPTPDMVEKVESSLKRLLQYGLSSGGALRTHLAVISSPGNLSEQQSSSGYRKRSGLGDVAAADVQGCVPLTGALKDCFNVQKAFRTGGTKLPNQTIMSQTFPRGEPKNISEKEVVLERISKATILRSLRFQLMVEDLDVYVLYYSGHGQVHSGTWLVTEDESISFQELLELSRSYAVPFGKLLVVIADSCYAGALCKAHKEAFNREKDRRAASNLIVFAATQPDLDAAENDDGGDFTTWFLTQLDVPLYTLFEKAKRQEVDQHGNDSFAIFRNVQKLPTRPLQKPMASGLLAFADVNKVQEPL